MGQMCARHLVGTSPASPVCILVGTTVDTRAGTSVLPYPVGTTVSSNSSRSKWVGNPLLHLMPLQPGF